MNNIYSSMSNGLHLVFCYFCTKVQQNFTEIDLICTNLSKFMMLKKKETSIIMKSSRKNSILFNLEKHAPEINQT